MPDTVTGASTCVSPDDDTGAGTSVQVLPDCARACRPLPDRRRAKPAPTEYAPFSPSERWPRTSAGSNDRITPALRANCVSASANWPAGI
ncbi:hypothetical protein G6F31_021277 [Rhizopus arrhizus]|nr:hypothetical protein G6F31_021277 [Rhizopus arrhizus]